MIKTTLVLRNSMIALYGDIRGKSWLFRFWTDKGICEFDGHKPCMVADATQEKSMV